MYTCKYELFLPAVLSQSYEMGIPPVLIGENYGLQLCQGIQLSGLQTWAKYVYQDISIYSVSHSPLMNLPNLKKTLGCFDTVRFL